MLPVAKAHVLRLSKAFTVYGKVFQVFGKSCIVIGLLALCAGLNRSEAESAPAFHLQDIEGHTFNLDQQLGRDILLVNFWATFCIPCLSELDTFSNLQNRHGRQGFRVIAVSVDQPQTQARVRSFALAKAFPFPVLFDPDQQGYRLYQISVLPTTVLIDRHGQIVFRKEGFEPGDEVDLERRIVELLEKPQSIDTAKDSATLDPTPSSLVKDSVQHSLSSSPDTKAVSEPVGDWLRGVSLSGSNFLRADYGRETRELPAPNGWWEDWFDFRIANEKLSYQGRFRGYQFLRDLPESHANFIRNPNQRVVSQTFAYQSNHADIRAGNFYGTLNRGLVLRTFEDRQARIDKNVKGAWASLKGGNSSATLGRARLSVFGGNTYSSFIDLYSMDAEENQLRDVYLQGLEGEWSPRTGITMGAQYLEAFRQDWHINLAGGNLEVLRGRTSLYLGYVGLKGENQFNYPNTYHGRALYGALSGNLGRLELGGEFKYYYNYDLGFADPPSLVKYHTFRLMARDILFPNNQREAGVQTHGTWQFSPESFYALNLSSLLSHPERNPSLLIHHVDLPFLDLDQTFQFTTPDQSRLLLGLNWNRQRKFEFGSFEDIHALTGGLTANKPLTGPWHVQGEFELQRRFTKFDSLLPPDVQTGRLGEVGAQYYHESPWHSVLSTTLSRNSAWTFTLDYEVTTSDKEKDADSWHYQLPGITNGWASAYLTLSVIEGNQISLWGGQRKDRVACSGGSCRIEPPFEGGELIWISHF